MESSTSAIQSQSSTPADAGARIPVVTYLVDHPWVIELARHGFDISCLVTVEHAVWNHREYQMPENVRFVSKVETNLYGAAVVPIGDLVGSPKALDLAHTFCQLEQAVGLPAVFVDWYHGKNRDAVREKAREIVAKTRSHPLLIERGSDWREVRRIVQSIAKEVTYPPTYKMRWELTGAPAWMRHVEATIHYLLLDAPDLKGVVVEADCGDGALLTQLHGRLAACEVLGVCRTKQELMTAQHTEPQLHIQEGDADTVRRKRPDCILVTDCVLTELDDWRDLAMTAKDRALITVNKSHRGVPPPHVLRRRFPGWTIHEILTHYVLTWRKR